MKTRNLCCVFNARSLLHTCIYLQLKVQIRFDFFPFYCLIVCKVQFELTKVIHYGMLTVEALDMMCQFTKVLYRDVKPQSKQNKKNKGVVQQLTIEALDMYCRPENINNKPMLTINALDMMC